jgi:hypothetical protein
MSREVTYFDIQEGVEQARQSLRAAAASGDIGDAIVLCALLIELIAMLNQKNAPK